jgi:hypothetical protein
MIDARLVDLPQPDDCATHCLRARATLYIAWDTNMPEDLLTNDREYLHWRQQCRSALAQWKREYSKSCPYEHLAGLHETVELTYYMLLVKMDATLLKPKIKTIALSDQEKQNLTTYFTELCHLPGTRSKFPELPEDLKPYAECAAAAFQGARVCYALVGESRAPLLTRILAKRNALHSEQRQGTSCTLAFAHLLSLATYSLSVSYPISSL